MTAAQLDLLAASQTQPPRPNGYQRRLIEEAGRGHTRAVKAAICPTCHRPTLKALDADVAAINATLDPDPVNQLGELLAVAAGRRTYDLVRGAGRYEIETREPAHITRGRRYPVLVAHDCDAAPLPADRTDADVQLQAPELPDRPPF